MADPRPDKERSRPETGQEGNPQEALGQSEAFLAFQEQLSRAARVDRPVLLIGERGTGKELAASRIHYLSARWQEPLVALNCSALSPSLIESELFGHEAGAFTGATARREGRFEAADGGTLFLDEVGAIPVQAQEKILRVVEYGVFERVGNTAPIRVDVRIVGATNAHLPTLAADGQFKEDLLDRLSFEVLFLPPLRERSEDIMMLARHFASRMSYELGWQDVAEFTGEAVDVLERYAWPGNIRELKNVIERAVYRSDDNIITAEEIILDPFAAPYASLEQVESRVAAAAAEPVPESADEVPEKTGLDALLEAIGDRPFEEVVSEVEVRFIRRALTESKYNQRRAAELLGLTYHQFRGLYRKYQDDLNE